MLPVPILFHPLHVAAIQRGEKSSTRRLPSARALRGLDLDTPEGLAALAGRCPYGPPGRRLWVRERHALFTGRAADGLAIVRYASDGAQRPIQDPRADRLPRGLDLATGRASIHMPHVATRLELTTTAVAAEFVQSMTHDDALAEGVRRWTREGDEEPRYAPPDATGAAPLWPWAECPFSALDAFARLWDSINGARAPWVNNPPVYAVSFRVAARLDGPVMREEK